MTNILLVRTDFLGDCILSSVFLEMLANGEEKVIDVLATNYNSSAFKYHPAVRNFYCINHEPGTKMMAADASELQKLTVNYDLVIVLNRDLRNYRYLKWIKASRVFGHRLGRKSFKSNMFCSIAAMLPKYNFIEYDQGIHEIENQVRLLNHVSRITGIKVMTSVPIKSNFYLANDNSGKLELLPSSILINISGRIGSFKYLNDSLVFSLLSLLKDRYTHFGLVVLPHEQQRLEAILNGVTPSNIEVICDQDIFVVAGKMQRYQAFIGCDGGLMHVAGSLGLRVVAVFHNQVIKCWHAWTPHQECVQTESRNIYDVSPLAIIDALDRLESQVIV